MRYNFIIINFVLQLVLLLDTWAQSASNDEAIAGRIDHFMSASVPNEYAASVLVAKNDEVLLKKGYGWADRVQKIPNRSSTVFNIGSVTKQFTAAAILKLQEEGKLNVSDRIEKYIPETPSDKQAITIHQLLTHSSGISPQAGGFRYQVASKQKAMDEILQTKLMYAPGTRHTYANANYILLAMVVEEVAQKDYESFLREHFWGPLQMDHTGYKNIPAESWQPAIGYYYDDTQGEWKDWGITQEHLPENSDHWYSVGKGDIQSTVEDLYKWHLALKENKVLNSNSKKLMEAAHVPENEKSTSFYGYGWAIFNSWRNTKVVAHNGSNGIYFADFLRFVDDNIVVIVLANVRLNAQSENAAWDIAQLVMDDQYNPNPIPKNPYHLVFDFIRNNEPEKAKELPEFLKQKTGSALKDKAILNRIGFRQVSNRLDIEWGIALLWLNTCLFPDDGNLWDSLGEGYYLINDKLNATQSFRRALELQPKVDCRWCDNATKRLNELSEGK